MKFILEYKWYTPQFCWGVDSQYLSKKLIAISKATHSNSFLGVVELSHTFLDDCSPHDMHCQFATLLFIAVNRFAPHKYCDIFHFYCGLTWGVSHQLRQQYHRAFAVIVACQSIDRFLHQPQQKTHYVTFTSNGSAQAWHAGLQLFVADFGRKHCKEVAKSFCYISYSLRSQPT